MSEASNIDALTEPIPAVRSEQFIHHGGQRDAVQWVFRLFCHGLHTIAINDLRFNRYTPVVYLGVATNDGVYWQRNVLGTQALANTVEPAAMLRQA